MKSPALTFFLLCALSLLVGCCSPREREAIEWRHEMRTEIRKARAELRASGATAAQLREFDRAVVMLERAAGKLEGQVRALEKTVNDE